ncbi:TetR/AcrR family transcriptional regulator [Streptomyces sp. LaPpAH-108]|uniref:TetR/AcrR family transcriptional regulator n=1 Tax=Streptomyces sp. LaPpAH-108 TaxID=1155714 RepID=UPI0003762C72|nr:TetR/AcrR family transcriptional regulator [Streptomyces sp. LaPpAH-108]
MTDPEPSRTPPRTPRLGRPPRLNRERIVTAALKRDLRTVTMRDLAEDLGVSHSALYRHVKNRDDLMDLVSETVVERIIPTTEPTAATWRDWLTTLAWRMHDEFLSAPGFAARVAAPHRHAPTPFARLRDSVTRAFRLAGADEEMAEQSWYVFGLGVTQWLGARQAGHEIGPSAPRFDLYLDVLLRGLPTREPEDPEAPSARTPPP